MATEKQRAAGEARRPVTIAIAEHTGPREELRPSFELAEDSRSQLDAYLHEGRVLVARGGERVVGHLQLTETGDLRELEVKNMAVAPEHRSQGVGRALVEAAVEAARADDRRRLRVATGAADTGALRFYQRLGFRLRLIERDAFTEATGYPPGLKVDGIELRDRVWLDREL